MTDLYWVECLTCGYDSQEAGFLDKDNYEKSICPICAEDSGKSITLTYTKATPEQIKLIEDKKDD